MSSVKQGASGHLLMPEGCTSITDLPADLAACLDHCYKILSWHEHLAKNEVPPQWMWHLDWEIEDWFIEVEQIREGQFTDGPDNRETVEMMGNEYSSRD